jgi:hypothetical protein
VSGHTVGRRSPSVRPEPIAPATLVSMSSDRASVSSWGEIVLAVPDCAYRRWRSIVNAWICVVANPRRGE